MKSRLNHKNFFVVLVCAVLVGLVVEAVVGEELPAEMNPGAVRGGDPNGKPEYVENELIVKFRGSAAETIEMGLAKGKASRELELSDSLDKLNNKYGLKKAKPLFKNFKSNRRQVQALLKKDKALLTKKEKHILGRLKRAPRDTKVPDLSRIYKLELELEAGQSLEDVVAAYNEDPDVEYAELNYVVSINLTLNDPLYSIQWPLNNTGQMYPESGRFNHPPGKPDCDIDAPEAWDIHTGGPEIVVAVIDTGVDYNHRDLQGNMWVNSDEIPSNGVDDDENGYVDDVYGYDFINDDSDPIDDHGHGTHCSGIIAADGDNGLDITGVCWDARIMGLKFLGADGTGKGSDAVTAIYYAVENGADVTSNSWGGGGYSQAMKEAINYAYSQGVVMVAASGNDNSDSPFYPAYYDHMIAVAATNSADQKASFSNYGNWVDIAAPGVDVLSLRAKGTSMGTRYDTYNTIASGTSMACPHVAGACALLLSTNPTLTNVDVYDTLMETVDPIAPGICQSGRLNLFKAMRTVLSSQGYINLDREYYSCSDVVSILLADHDLADQGSLQVTPTTSGGDSETLILTETTSSIGVFIGTIPTASGDPNTGDGTLQVSHGEVITIVYEDEDDGMGNPATVTETAEADCQGPIIFNIEVDVVGPEPTVTFETDEPSSVRLLYGLACDGPHTIVEPSYVILPTSHTIKLTEISPETTYYFIIEANDTFGYKTIDDSGGHCYTFTTSEASDLYVPSQYGTIQEAIDVAWSNTTVWVADGVYTGPGNRDIDFLGRAITVRSTDPNDSDIVATTIIDCNGTESNPHRGFYFHNGEDGNSVLNGLTITNGYASGSWPEVTGGGILCYHSSPTITNCAINDNIAGGGGGISCENSSPTIKNCIINNNLAHYGGGGVLCYESSLTITNCIINGNRASRDEGGGISCWESNLTITNCILNSNSAEWVGGGISSVFCPEDGLTIANCTLTKNSARLNGGGIWCGQVIGPAITNCEFSDNSAEFGGALECYATDNAIISNCIFSNNSAKFGGALNYGLTLESTLTNCTISGNTAETGGGINCYRSSPTIINSILWSNQAIDGLQIYLKDNSNASVSYTDVQDDQNDVYIGQDCTLDWGLGNIDTDPCFVQPGYWDANNTSDDVNDDFWVEGDYYLLPNSLCIDTGDPNYIPEPDETDIDGNPRIIGSRIDIGAYETNYIQAAMKLTPQMLNCNSKGNFVKAHLTLPEGFLPQDVDVNEPAVAEPMGIESEYIRVFGNDDGPVRLEITFDREAFCDGLTETGEVEITIIGSLTTSRYFYATDTIKIKPRR